MYELNKQDYQKIKSYKRFKQEEIALYFYEKFSKDLLYIIFNKINLKFSSIPLEKGDLIHIIWNSIKKTLKEYKDGDNFCASLQRNCYFQTVNEVKKFIKNDELILNVSSSAENLKEKYGIFRSKNGLSNPTTPEKILLDDLVKNACTYIKNYTQPTIKRVIYLKSMGYSISKICKLIRKSRHHVEEILSCIQDVVKRMFF